MIRYIRKLGQEKIVERIKAYKKNEYIPNDILSAILKSHSKEQISKSKNQHQEQDLINVFTLRGR
jgi:hypothetical protein